MVIHPKINLGLHVLGRRPDGYHDIETLMVPFFGLEDRLEIEPAPRCSIEFSGSVRVDWAPQDDLTMKAYRLLREEFGLPPVRIMLEKHIPVGAGLGGGSADAAAALKLLSGCFSLGLGEEELLSRAALLGSDCPFFVLGRPCIASGRGERLAPYEIDLSGYEIRLQTPPVRVSTAEAYAGVCIHEGIGLREALSHPVAEWRDVLCNDFEKTVFARYPELSGIKSAYYDAGAVYASMSGSGSSVFALFRRN